MAKTKFQAAQELLPIYNSMEVRKIKLQTLVRKMWHDGVNYRCHGTGYDYTV